MITLLDQGDGSVTNSNHICRNPRAGLDWKLKLVVTSFQSGALHVQGYCSSNDSRDTKFNLSPIGAG